MTFRYVTVRHRECDNEDDYPLYEGRSAHDVPAMHCTSCGAQIRLIGNKAGQNIDAYEAVTVTHRLSSAEGSTPSAPRSAKAASEQSRSTETQSPLSGTVPINDPRDPEVASGFISTVFWAGFLLQVAGGIVLGFALPDDVLWAVVAGCVAAWFGSIGTLAGAVAWAVKWGIRASG